MKPGFQHTRVCWNRGFMTERPGAPAPRDPLSAGRWPRLAG